MDKLALPTIDIDTFKVQSKDDNHCLLLKMVNDDGICSYVKIALNPDEEKLVCYLIMFLLSDASSGKETIKDLISYIMKWRQNKNYYSVPNVEPNFTTKISDFNRLELFIGRLEFQTDSIIENIDRMELKYTGNNDFYKLLLYTDTNKLDELYLLISPDLTDLTDLTKSTDLTTTTLAGILGWKMEGNFIKVPKMDSHAMINYVLDTMDEYCEIRKLIE